ncbi:MAG: ParB/RepB/Spo0J family partition protein [Eubacteriales bacterium]|nr:ParB/RepB/Spo0J family partition protein [Eubacteriales bacterium]
MKNNNTELKAKAAKLPVTALHPFKDHPYKVQDNEEMDALVESIRENGIMSPLIVRPLENSENEYEVVSGHRRLHAAQKAGITEVPALIYTLDRDAAAIAVVDSNLHREHILPSEKAFAYKMKMEAIAHQGVTRGQVGHKSREEISDTESGRQVQRYIRLTHLIPELLAYMDEGKMALSVGVELSYLYEEHQRAVAEASEYYDCTPSYAQAVRLRKESAEKYCILTPKRIFKILGEEKANQREKVSFQVGDLRKYFPENYTAKEMQNTILRLLEQEHQRQHRSRDYER